VTSTAFPASPKRVPSTLVRLWYRVIAEVLAVAGPRVEIGQLSFEPAVFAIPDDHRFFRQPRHHLPTAWRFSFVGCLAVVSHSQCVNAWWMEDSDFEAEARAQGIANIRLPAVWRACSGRHGWPECDSTSNSAVATALQPSQQGVSLILVISLSGCWRAFPMAALGRVCLHGVVQHGELAVVSLKMGKLPKER